MLSKIKITIDFYGPEVQFYHSNAQIENSEFLKRIVNFFQTLLLKSLLTICTIIYLILKSLFTKLQPD